MEYDYEEKYNQTVESIKRIYEQADSYGKKLMEKEFPELRESEDEKIRNRLIEFISCNPELISDFNAEKGIAWLERQGEQKSIWSEEDEKIWYQVYDNIRSLREKATLKPLKDIFTTQMDWIKSVRERIKYGKPQK